MGVCGCSEPKHRRKNNDESANIPKGTSYIKCTYEINDFNFVQIINYRGKTIINKEIESKIKIWNGEDKEQLIFQKKFCKIGPNVIYFIIEEKINDMSFLFNDCCLLKNIEFNFIEPI